MFIPMEVTRRSSWSLIQQHFGQIVRMIKYYEIREATMLFELAMWKAKMMNQAGDDITLRDRDSYRYEVPGPVKDAILQYLL